MSTKTIYKRIALVAVAALGAGVLSVAPANAADNAAAGAGNATTAASVLNIATAPSITGAAVTSVTFADQRSLGLLANSTTMGNGLTQTATIRSTGAIVVYLTGVTDGASTISVTGGTISAHTGDKTINVNSTKTQLVTVDDSAALKISAAITPSAGSTTMRIEYHQAAAVTAVDDGSTEAAVAASIQAGATSRGTLTGAINVTVATTSLSGAYSAADSLVNIDADGSGAATGIDETGANVIANSASSAGFININLLDAYGVSLDSVGALVVTATNGAGVRYAAGGGASTPVNLTDVSNDTSGTITVARPAAFANKGFSTTVTITWNGTVVGSKSFTFQGEVASVTASSPKIGALSASNTSAFRLAYADNAGNVLYPTITDTSAVAATLNTVVTGLSVGTIGSSTAGLAKGTLTCGASAGSADVQVQHVNPLSGTVVKSNVWKAVCAGDAYTYTASWDKASYTPGSIATLSISFKDSKGNLANAYTAVSTTASLITITGGPSATAVTAPADQDKASSADGVKTYQFVVGTTEGDFSAVVSVPVVNANGVAANQTVSYKVANATGTVSNADVLKAIVSLIASINKQIAALQKALLRR
jgi:trimeric autotransporter adhesin